MALFKIFNNKDTLNRLPNTYHAGFCYFDVETQKFWIDTSDTADGRLPLNSVKANMADVASHLAFGYCLTAGVTAEKRVIFERIYDVIPQLNSDPLLETLINDFPFGTLLEGTMIAVYFEHGNTVASPTLSLSYQTESLLGTNNYTTLSTRASVWCTNSILATEEEEYSWGDGSLVIFTFVNNKWIMSGWRAAGSSSILRRWDRLTGPIVGTAILPTGPLVR